MRTFNELPTAENVGDIIMFENEPQRNRHQADDDDDVVLVEDPSRPRVPDLHHRVAEITAQDDSSWSPATKEKKKYIFMAVIFFITVLVFGLVVHSATEQQQQHKNDPFSSSFIRFKSEQELASLRSTIMSSIDANVIRATSIEYSRLPHLAGGARNTELAHMTAQRFRDWGFDEVKEQILPATLSVLKRRAVTVLTNKDSRPDHYDPTILYRCKLDEDNSLNMPKEIWNSILPTSNGYSGSGHAEGHLVWANWGRDEDFVKLDQLGINLTGTIVMVRYGKIFRGNKVHLAATRGAAGVLIVNDPGIVGPGMMNASSSQHPRKVFPDGPWANATNVQRGSINLGQGDPATPGFPSQNHPLAPRLTNDELFDNELMQGHTLPKIPVQPLGWGDARSILSHTFTASEASDHALPESWQDTGFLNELAKGGIGPSKNVLVRVEVDRELQVFNLTNVMASLTGEIEPDRTVIIGAHRDSWGNAGAVDPISGTSVVLEIARVIGQHHKKTGWRPRRTLQFASWDAEEWSIIGSDEYVEMNVELLRQRAIALLNLDTAVSGNQKLWADGSPLLHAVFETAAKEIPRPTSSSSSPSSSLFDMMSSPEKGRSSAYSPPAAGTDTVGFFSIAGVPVIDASFYNDDPEDAYEAVYHSYADTVYWIDHFADPGFVLHAAMARLYLCVALKLTEPVLLPMNVEKYASSIQGWVDDYKTKNVAAKDFDWRFMDKSVERFLSSAKNHNKRLQLMPHQNAQRSPFEIRALNDISFGVERVFLGQSDIETGMQSWFRHVIYTPNPKNSYGSSVMPMIGLALANYQQQQKEGGADSLLKLNKRKRDVELAIGRIAQYVFRAGTFVNSSSVMPPDDLV